MTSDPEDTLFRMDKDIDSVEPDTYADRIVGSRAIRSRTCLRLIMKGGTAFKHAR